MPVMAAWFVKSELRILTVTQPQLEFITRCVLKIFINPIQEVLLTNLAGSISQNINCGPDQATKDEKWL